MTTPTKETHRYVGMWRPPFEEVTKRAEDSFSCKSVPFVCTCGVSLMHTSGGIAWKLDREKRLDHWLAGHFDEPIYEPLAEDKESESSGVVESFRRMTPIDLSQTFPVDEGAAKGKVIETCAISGNPERIAPGHDIRDHSGELFGRVAGFVTDSSGKSSIVATRIRPMDACPVCFHRFEMGQPPHFKAEEGGQCYDGERPVHWKSGTQTCPECGATWQYGDSD